MFEPITLDIRPSRYNEYISFEKDYDNEPVDFGFQLEFPYDDEIVHNEMNEEKLEDIFSKAPSSKSTTQAPRSRDISPELTVRKAIRKTKKKLKSRKKRLYGSELIDALRNNPVFAKHEELFDKNLTDATRKKLMQKIRNRISAQESRDRKKMVFQTIEVENEKLKMENGELKDKIKQLETDNMRLRLRLNKNGSLSLEETNDSSSLDEPSLEFNYETADQLTEIGQLIRDQSKGGDLNWKTLSIFLVGVMVCTMTLTDKQAAGLPMRAGGIVPLLGRNILPVKERAKSLALAENICSKFYKNHNSLNLQRGIEVSRQLHTITNQLHCSEGEDPRYASNEFTLMESDIPKTQSIVPVTQTRYHTVYCNSAVELSGNQFFFDQNKELIHLVIPANKNPEDEGYTNSMIPEGPDEYISIIAKIIGTKKIKIDSRQEM